uniref:Uncharacterized protein n=1 Tax=Paramormyrops kingsleyae TaxID=1676925 RepID=A0A3B3QMM4_9TELE
NVFLSTLLFIYGELFLFLQFQSALPFYRSVLQYLPAVLFCSSVCAVLFLSSDTHKKWNYCHYTVLNSH